MSRYILSPEARDDLNEIADYIAQDSPKAARRVVQEQKAAMERLAQMPASDTCGTISPMSRSASGLFTSI